MSCLADVRTPRGFDGTFGRVRSHSSRLSGVLYAFLRRGGQAIPSRQLQIAALLAVGCVGRSPPVGQRHAHQRSCGDRLDRLLESHEGQRAPAVRSRVAKADALAVLVALERLVGPPEHRAETRDVLGNEEGAGSCGLGHAFEEGVEAADFRRHVLLDERDRVGHRPKLAFGPDDQVLDVRGDDLLGGPRFDLPDLAHRVFHSCTLVDVSLGIYQAHALAFERDAANARTAALSCLRNDKHFDAHLAFSLFGRLVDPGTSRDPFQGMMCLTCNPRSLLRRSASKERWQAAASRSTQNRATTRASGPNEATKSALFRSSRHSCR